MQKKNKVETHSIISDGYKNVTGLFDCITLNPPIRAGKETIFKLYDETYKHLNPDGEFWIVIPEKTRGTITFKIFTKFI